jgi:hypothetical protein
MAIIFQILAAILALFFIFLTYMNTKTWRWLHVTVMFFVFAASMAFCFYAAMVLKTRAAWIKLHDDLERQVQTTTEQLDLIMRGDPKDIARTKPSVASLREDLGRTILDRGRVWRGCTPAFNADGTVTVSTVPPADPNLPAPPARKNNIAPKTILHVFREASQPNGMTLPAAYIGEFEVSAATDATATLFSTMPLSPDQVAAGRAGGTWTLYESCPADGHEWFAGQTNEQLAALLPGNPQDPQYQKLIESYVRDGQRGEETDPPENIWFEVKFLQPVTVPVDAPNAMTSFEAGAAEPLFPFNSDGQALLQRLRRAEEGKPAESVTFGPSLGQVPTAVLDQQTAEALVAEGKAEKVRPIFRRKLNDYEQKLHAIYLRMLDINSRGRQLTIDNQATVATTEKASQQAMLVEELKGKLNDDLAKARFEQAELKKYSDALDARLAAVQTQLSDLYKSNKAISRELVKLNDDLTREIDRRTRESTASNP